MINEAQIRSALQMVRTTRLVQWPMLLLLGCLLVPCIASAQRKKKHEYIKAADNGGSCDTTGWKLVFHDEFEGAGLDRSKWITYYPFSDDGSEKCASCRFMGGTNSIYMDDQVSVCNGHLNLGIKAETTTWYGKTTEHRGSTIRSIGSAEFNYGKFEMRCMLPIGKGIWPAFWMFGGETEIDVYEICGEKPKWIKGSLHRWGETKFSNTGKHKGEDYSEDFHTYAVEWDPDELRWYVDGMKIHSRGRYVDQKGRPLPPCDREKGMSALAPYFPRPQDKVNVIAGNAVSEAKGFCKGPKKPSPWGAGSSLIVDYIRVYQRQPQQGLSDLCNTPSTLRITGGETRMSTTEERTIVVDGPHGSLEWETSPGLRVSGRSLHGITVGSNGNPDKQWVRVTSRKDPCTGSDHSLEIALVVTP